MSIWALRVVVPWDVPGERQEIVRRKGEVGCLAVLSFRKGGNKVTRATCAALWSGVKIRLLACHALKVSLLYFHRRRPSFPFARYYYTFLHESMSRTRLALDSSSSLTCSPTLLTSTGRCHGRRCCTQVPYSVATQ